MRTQYVLYGLGGVEDMYRALRYEVLNTDGLRVNDIQFEAVKMIEKNPSIKSVYLLDNRRGLGWEFHQSNRKATIESCAIFKDTLEREGIKII